MAPTFGAVTVLIADADDSRAMLADVLAEFDDCQVVAIAAAAEEAIDLAARHCPQIVLLHVDVPGGGGAHATRGIRAVSPRTRVLALGAAGDSDSVRAMLSAGARGHLPRHAGTHELLRSVRQCVAHAAPVADRVPHSVVAEINSELQSKLPRDRLRDRKRERILRLIDAGGPQVVIQPI